MGRGKLEVARAMRLQAVPVPNSLQRTHTYALRLVHCGCGPTRRFARWAIRQRRLHDPGFHVGAEWRDTGRVRLVAQQSRDALDHEAFLS